MQPSPTLDAVAERAGVHAATVSRVLNRPEVVRPETRARVQQAVAELGYVPNRAARQLAGGETGIIALLVPDIANPYFAALLQCAQRQLQAGSALATVADTDRSAAEELRLIAGLAPNFGGFVLCSPVAPSGAILDALGSRRAVVVNRRIRRLASVALDQRAIVALALDHLRELGHERMASLLGPRSFWSTQERERAFSELAPETLHLPCAPTYTGGFGAAAAVVDSEATGVICFNDAQAIGLIHGLAAAGVGVPDQVSVVGSDDVVLAAMCNPPLTTVAASFDELASVALSAMSQQTRTHRSLEASLVVRDSTGRPG